MLAPIVYIIFCVCVGFGSSETLLDCGNPPSVDRTSINIQNAYPPGSIVEYTCDFGYIPSGYPRTAICEYDNYTDTANWTLSNFQCMPRSCSDPGTISNGRRIGSVFTFASKIEYACEDGYKLEGNVQRFCQASGTWSGKAPLCTKIYCKQPKQPEHGYVIYDSLEYGAQLKYECNKGYMLQGEAQRTCSKDGEWNGTDPDCVELYCKEPKDPEHGKVEVVSGKTTVGSIAFYTCNEGYTLHGSKTSKCFHTGEWTFSAPQCLEYCKVPEVENGYLGIKNRQRKLQKLSPGSNIDVGKEMFLKCSKKYEPSGLNLSQLKITCRDGAWSSEPICKPASCRGNPPSVPNTHLETVNQEHGTLLNYECNDGFIMATPGSIECKYGSWTGRRPICRDPRCYAKDINFHGLKPPDKKVYKSEEVIMPQCNDGYELASLSNLTCINGLWEGVLPPCKPAKCTGPPPDPIYGSITSYKLDHLSTATVSCKEGYGIDTNLPLPQCSFGKWKSHDDICKETRCFVRDIKTNVGVDLEFDKPTYSGEYGKIQCLEGFTSRNDQQFCQNGIWEFDQHISPCVPQSCVVDYVNHGEFQYITNEWITRITYLTKYIKEKLGTSHVHGSELYIFCHKPYVFHGRRSTYRHKVTCTKGKWSPEPICLLVGQKVPAQPIQPKKKTPLVASSDRNSSGSTESSVVPLEEKISNKTDALVTDFDNSPKDKITSCTCTYHHNDPAVLAFSEGRLIENGNMVKNGCNVTFICYSLGYQYLIGVQEMQCLNCVWNVKEFPTCQNSSPYDARIVIQKPSPDALHVKPPGHIVVPTGMHIIFTCLIENASDYPEFVNLPPHIQPVQSYQFHGESYTTYSRIEITQTDFSHSGKYECEAPPNGHSNHITIEVSEIRICPEITKKSLIVTYNSSNNKAFFRCVDSRATLKGPIEVTCLQNTRTWSDEPPTCEMVLREACPLLNATENMDIYYSDNQEINSQAHFSCKMPHVLIGVPIITCLSNKKWSDEVPTCKPVFCSIETLLKQLPENVVPLERNITSDEVLYGEILQLYCNGSNLHAFGTQNATCSKSGNWIVEDISCVLGCDPVTLPNDSLLIIEPAKEVYRFGEFVTISCPSGYKLSFTLVKMVCLKDKWSAMEENIPVCEKI